MDGVAVDPRRTIPSVDAIAARVAEIDPSLPAPLVVREARKEIARVRSAIGSGAEPPAEALVAEAVAAAVRLMLRNSPRGAVNATGIIIHTNLGRAPLSDEAIEAVAAASMGYSDLELNVKAGKRGSRRVHVEETLRELTGAEAALVVNNNAAAVFLCLAGMAEGREVVVSRGEAVEIGGSFRIPEILSKSGAVLVDVGTTNRTRVSDYANAAGPATALFLKVHRSNFKIVGFAEEAGLRELCEAGRDKGVPIMNDLGSGTLIDTAPFGLEREPTVQQSVADGAALTTFSGDKLLGGPQAGIIVGRREFVDAVSNHPLARALRPDKMCIAALRATLLHYLRGEAVEKIPVWRMIAAPASAIQERARRWGKAVPGRLSWQVKPVKSAVGGGSLPGETLPSWALRLDPGRNSADSLARTLRSADPPVVARVEDGAVLLDPRTVPARDDLAVVSALERL